MPYADPERQRAAKREYARRARAGRMEPSRGTVRQPLVSGELRLRTAADVLVVIESQTRAVLGDQELGTVERARTIALLAGVGLRAVEAADLAARVEAVEQVLAVRGAAG